MTFTAAAYPDLVRDLLTTLTGGTVAETHPVPLTGLGDLYFLRRPVRRVSHLAGEVEVGGQALPYRFTERDYDPILAADGSSLDGVRFGRGQIPAPGSLVTVNYYPTRLEPTPLNDVTVGSVVRTLLETIARELATQSAQLQLVYESAFVDTATGSSLDHVAALVGVTRLRRGHPLGHVTLTRRQGSAGEVFVPVDTAITDGAGNRYLVSDPATMLPTQSTLVVAVHGESPTTEVVDAGALVVLERAIAGVDRVRNDQPTFLAAAAETDDQLRGRTKAAATGSGRGTLDAIRAGLEALAAVSAVGLVELPDGVPGTLRVDVALTEDTAFTRHLVARRLEELRPAGILVTMSFAGRLDLALDVTLTLAGAAQPASVVDEITDGVRARLAEAVRGLAPGATLRRAQLVAAALADPRVVDAGVAPAIAGVPVSADSLPLPADQAVQLDPVNDIRFAPVTFESAAAATGPALLPTDVRLGVTLLDAAITLDAVRQRIRDVLRPVLGAATAVDVTTVQTALAGEAAAFVASGAATLVSVETAPGVFTEIHPGDPPFNVPVGATLELREVLAEVAT